MLAYTLRPTLIIEHLDVDLESQSVNLQAVGDGLAAALLRLLGIGNKCVLSIDSTGVRLKTIGFLGETRTYCPLPNITASVYSRANRVEFLLAAFFLGFFGCTTTISGVYAMIAALFVEEGPSGTEAFIRLIMGILFLGLAALSVYLFRSGKNRVIIGVVTNATTVEALKVKAKGNQLSRLGQAATIMETVINQGASAAGSDGGLNLQNGPDAQTRLTTASVSSAADPSDSDEVIHCPSCDVRLKLKASKRGTTVTCPSCHEQFEV